MKLSWFTPKKFLCQYPLAIGAMIYALIMIFLNIACVIIVLIELIGYSSCDSCTYSVLRTSYAFGGTAVIYCMIMILVNLWFIWAIKTERSSVVLVWVVVTSMWLLHTFCLTVVLMCMFTHQVTFVIWIICVIFGLLGFCIAGYGVAVGLGLWREMKTPVQEIEN